MLARTHKPLSIVNQYQLLANSTITAKTGSSAALHPMYLTPLQQWSQRSLSSTDASRDPAGKPPADKTGGCVRSCESETSISSKKYFVVAPSRSLSSVEKHVTPAPEQPSCTNPTLPPKPKAEQRSLPAPPDHQRPEQLDRVKASITAWIESLRNLNWSTALFKTRDQVVGATGAIVAPGNVERVRQGVAVAWGMSVRAVQNLIYWIRVFLDSREYFYMRYYTLLLLENTLYYARLGLTKIIQMARNFKM